MDGSPKIECSCGFATFFDTIDANIAALEIHSQTCPDTYAEAPKAPMSWAQATAVSVFIASFAAMIWALAWAVH